MISTAMGQPSNKELLEAWAQGSADAGAALFKQHFDLLFRFFASKVNNETVIDDLVQQTFLACLEHRERLGEVHGFRAYVLGIARRRLMRFIRGSYREQRAMDAYGPCAEDLMPSMGSALSARSEIQAIAIAIRRIPLDFQILLELHYHESMRIQEIAEVLQIPPGTVKSRLSRARDALTQAVEQLQAEPALRHNTTARLEFWTSSLGEAKRSESSQ